MKISHVLLRWYRSFNINYGAYEDRRHGIVSRPWNNIASGNQDDYRFIEIPIQQDITTIVGGNESGKSHLVSAINKVINGVGIPDADDRQKPFHFTDLCHYAGEQKKNIDTWPNIGLRFVCDHSEFESVMTAAGKTSANRGTSFTLILDQQTDHVAILYASDSESISLDQSGLDAVRQLLPKVEFIRSTRPMSDEIEIADLLAALTGREPESKSYFPFALAQEGLEFLTGLSFSTGTQLKAEDLRPLTNFKEKIEKQKQAHRAKVELELQLIRDVLKIETGTLEKIAALSASGRSFTDGLMSVWNEELERELNLSHFWQQDDAFRLRLNFKAGVFYFEITDKTGAIYTFKERSSGLRYFLSYYIQAKALESKAVIENRRECILLMDEPDSFLSIVGQRNLMGVFESLVFQSKLKQGIQLIYTTHSPFLINKNFPQRIRLVRKGDGEEGTQYVEESRVRRYEPVRSALGIDCAQTLFMGEANVIVEGPTDQFILSELTRLFASQEGMDDLLDLNSIVLMSADSAPGVEKILRASRWADEQLPATVVVFDNDDEGQLQRDRVVGKSKKMRGQKKLIDESFALTINQLFDNALANTIVTTEDVIPESIYMEAVSQFLKSWYSEDEVSEGQRKEVAVLKAGEAGVVEIVGNFFKQHVHGGQSYDKMGVFLKVLDVVREGLEAASETGNSGDAAIVELGKRLVQLSTNLKRKVEESRREVRSSSIAQSIKRAIDDFFKRFKAAGNTFDIQLLLERCNSLAKSIGEDAKLLRDTTDLLLERVHSLREADQSQVTGENWSKWKQVIGKIRENPLSPDVKNSITILQSSNKKVEDLATQKSKIYKSVEEGTGGRCSEPTVKN